MPRRPAQRIDNSIDITDFNDIDTRENEQKKPVSDFLKNNFYDMLKKNNNKIECPVCYENIDCRNCFNNTIWSFFPFMNG